jgi:hypothetical protein
MSQYLLRGDAVKTIVYVVIVNRVSADNIVLDKARVSVSSRALYWISIHLAGDTKGFPWTTSS